MNIDNNVVLNTTEMLFTFPENEPLISNLVTKLYRSLHINECLQDTLYKSLPDGLPIENDFSNITLNKDILKSIPIMFPIRITDNDVTIYLKDKTVTVSRSNYDNIILNNSLISILPDDGNIKIPYNYYKDSNSKILKLTVFDAVELGMSIYDLKLVDTETDMVFVHMDIPTLYVQDIINSFTGYDIVFTNTKKYLMSWLPDGFIDDVVSINITTIGNTRIRKLTLDMKHIINGAIVKDNIKKLINVIKAYINNYGIESLLKVYPILNDLLYDTEMTLLTFGGYKSNIVINTFEENATINDRREERKKKREWCGSPTLLSIKYSFFIIYNLVHTVSIFILVKFLIFR